MASSSSNTNVQEFNIRVPKNIRKKHHVMRFNATLNVDFAKWRNVKLERENNMKEFRGMEEEMPKFGAGSEYNRDLREEARRKKFGIIAKKYRPEAQPWILKVGGKSGKKFKGIREVIYMFYLKFFYKCYIFKIYSRVVLVKMLPFMFLLMLLMVPLRLIP